MLHLRNLSWLLVGLGVMLAIAGEVSDLGSAVTLIGLMLVVAGVVKVVTVRIWHGFFDADSAKGDGEESAA